MQPAGTNALPATPPVYGYYNCLAKHTNRLNGYLLSALSSGFQVS